MNPLAALEFPDAETPPYEVVVRLPTPFGPCVGVAIPDAGRARSLPAHLGERLCAEELAWAQQARAPRAATFLAGRLALREAFAAAGLPEPPPLLPQETGAPALPANAWGSLSHKHNLAVAIAAPAEGEGGLGIDLESTAPGRFDISSRVLTPEERQALASCTPEAQALQTRMAFCIKEALYKAAHPLVRAFFGFHEGHVALPLPIEREKFCDVLTTVVPARASAFPVTSAALILTQSVIVAVARATGNPADMRRNKDLAAS